MGPINVDELFRQTARTGVFGVPGTEERKKALKSMEQIDKRCLRTPADKQK